MAVRRSTPPRLVVALALLVVGLLILLLLVVVRGPSLSGSKPLSDQAALANLPPRRPPAGPKIVRPIDLLETHQGSETTASSAPENDMHIFPLSSKPARDVKHKLAAVDGDEKSSGSAVVHLPPNTVAVHPPSVAPESLDSNLPPPFRSYPDIHAQPLSPAAVAVQQDAVMKLLEPEANDHRRSDPVSLDDNANAIARLYRDVKSPPADDPLRRLLTGPLWSQRPLLTTVILKWVVFNRQVRSGNRKARMVSVRPVGQLCNRLMAITSAFVFALVTQRALHVEDGDFYATLPDLFVEPGFPWTTVGAAIIGGNAHYLQNPEGGVWEEMEPLLCADYAKHYRMDQVHFAINQYLVPYITTNPHYRAPLQELFGGDDIFTPASHFLFRPIDRLLQLRDEYVAAHFKGKFVVGLQVRSGGDFTDHFMNDHDWGLYQRCGESMTPAEFGKKLVYFVATDTAKGREAAAAKLGQRKVMFGPGEFQLSNNPEGVQMALLDLLLLAAANDRVTTAWSSYGYFAAGFSGVPAGIVVDQVEPDKWIARNGEEQRFMGIMHKSDTRRQCVRLPVHQPCFHKFESWGASKATCFRREWFEREMLNGRYC